MSIDALKPMGSTQVSGAPEPRAKPPSLDDKFDLAQTHVILNGNQAIVRLTLMQHAKDRKAGLNTAGLVTGYRGSPIAGLEGQFQRAVGFAQKSNIVFMPGLNEDLAATALWGAQQAELRGEGKYDGVFGVWYGKGPGVDRTGDAFRHANHAGTSKHGGVLALMGDDHTCESSTSAHQSEFAFLDAMIPVINPAGVQEMLDYGLYGFALSRFAGVWVGMKCVKDNIESTASVDASLERVTPIIPEDFMMPEGGLNIRLGDQALAKEARLHDHKRPAIVAFTRANKLDRIIFKGGTSPKIGIITTGKSYLDTRQALEELGVDEERANALGIRLYKIAVVWPLESQGLAEFARGLDMIIVVEEKRALIETQVKEQLYRTANAPVVIGKKDENEAHLFPAKAALEPTDIAIAVGERIVRFGGDEATKSRLIELKRHRGNKPEGTEVAVRQPYFCAGCPHNSSTVVPKGAHAYAGIGCHFMAQWMDRSTDGFTQMGGEGTNWIGEAPFSKRRHVFQNLGDGTYIHSGSLAVRAAAASGANITYKILYNDAVAMTGGQKLEGGFTAAEIARQVIAEGSKKTVMVTDQPEKYTSVAELPREVEVHHRRDLQDVQKRLSDIDGLTVLIYDQTCAAEKRRRRKRGLFPDPPKRAFINTAVCEGCGDCGVKSNCVAIVPVETEFGRKRAVDQSACNKDFSCVEGFCPSFVTVHGGSVRKPAGAAGHSDALKLIASLPEPKFSNLDIPYSIVLTGIGGTGVVTVSAILAEAAHLDGKGVGAIEMAGLAQKGGAVACHLRFAKDQNDIHAIRVGIAGADLVLGCDLVVTASNKVMETVRKGDTHVTLNTYEQLNGDFTRNTEIRLPTLRIKQAITERAGESRTHMIDAHDLAVRLFGDSIGSNMLMLGYSYQLGLVPVSAAAIEQAIALNGAAVEMNKRVFRFGRLVAHDPKAIAEIISARDAVKKIEFATTLGDIVTARKMHLTGYQDADLAERYAKRIGAFADVERAKAPGKTGLAEAAARAYAKLLAYKDEYEVARLFSEPAFQDRLSQQFEGDYKLSFHLSPPLIAPKNKTTGEPRKIELGSWTLPLFRQLAKLKRVRGTRWDLFGYTAERRMERGLIARYEATLDEIGQRLTPSNHAIALELASLPEKIRGFGHVKQKSLEGVYKREAELLGMLRAPAPVPTPVRIAAE